MEPAVTAPSGVEMIAGVLVIPLILGLIEVAKSAGMNTKWSPTLALVLGLALSIGYAAAQSTRDPMQYFQAVLIGAAYGLSASGLYSGLARPVVKAAQVKYWGPAEAAKKDREW